MFDEIIRDKPFFADSGGGLTIGGGEATCWPDFCLEMIRLCHEAGINVAIDTCGYVIGEKRFSVLEQADLILFDIKGLNDAAHIANTGVSNRVIHENLRRLDALGKSVIIRYPMIPGYNLDEAEAIADYLTQFSCIERVDLIGYHRFGGQVRQIGMTYTVAGGMPAQQRQEDPGAISGQGS